jgi:hypothetical protein
MFIVAMYFFILNDSVGRQKYVRGFIWFGARILVSFVLLSSYFLAVVTFIASMVYPLVRFLPCNNQCSLDDI